jgi:transcriptional regulator GlxA family with amidase domain
MVHFGHKRIIIMHSVGFVVFPQFQVMGLSSVSVFEVANQLLGTQEYEMTLLSEQGGTIRTTSGFQLDTEAFGRRTFDTVIIGAGLTVNPSTPGLLDFIRFSAGQSRRVASLCLGTFVLAEAGVLAGRHATTHWMQARELQARYPDIKVDEDRIFVVDGNIWTGAGMAASIDLALALVEKDHGLELAQAVARQLVVHHRRAGGQSQFSALLDLKPKSDRIQKAIEYASAHLTNALSVEELAEAAGLSPRHFSRAFRAETGRSPAKAVEGIRVEAARLMMERGRHPMDVIARETGFTDRERMRRAFLRTLGQPPQIVRRAARAET